MGDYMSNEYTIRSCLYRCYEKGSPGERGPVGPIGERGAQGINGAQGQQGARGPAGFRGNIGWIGTMGNQGAQGITFYCSSDTSTKKIHSIHTFTGAQGPIGAGSLLVVFSFSLIN
jgi:hypothetical protein